MTALSVGLLAPVVEHRPFGNKTRVSQQSLVFLVIMTFMSDNSILWYRLMSKAQSESHRQCQLQVHALMPSGYYHPGCDVTQLDVQVQRLTRASECWNGQAILCLKVFWSKVYFNLVSSLTFWLVFVPEQCTAAQGSWSSSQVSRVAGGLHGKQ